MMPSLTDMTVRAIVAVLRAMTAIPNSPIVRAAGRQRAADGRPGAGGRERAERSPAGRSGRPGVASGPTGGRAADGRSGRRRAAGRRQRAERADGRPGGLLREFPEFHLTTGRARVCFQ